ncbi:hypothetical protein EJ110_NYTH55994 [Nymphaea thermarum]|nr:hypothetical protein EJ110_NYTH55994 [Nymphaea thermarum]
MLNITHSFEKNNGLQVLSNFVPSITVSETLRKSFFTCQNPAHHCFISVFASQNHTTKRNRKHHVSPKKTSNEKLETLSNPSQNFLMTTPQKTRFEQQSGVLGNGDFMYGSLECRHTEMDKPTNKILSEQETLRSVDKEEEEHGEGQAGIGAEEGEQEEEVGHVLDAENSDWPLDADVGWGVRASEFFDKYPIRNVVDENGVEVDWEGEMEAPWVKEINCLEWESFAFHPSPLVVLVFERYNKIADNWRAIKELEAAARIYWNSKNRLPPRTVKIDINIERDLAYALKVRECPQLLFLRGNRILYREKDIRSADELVQMIAFFYYNARMPSWVDANSIAPPY